MFTVHEMMSARKESFEWRRTKREKSDSNRCILLANIHITVDKRTKKRGTNFNRTTTTTWAVFMQFSTVSVAFFSSLDPCLTIRRKQHSNTMTNQIVLCAQIPRHRLPNIPYTEARGNRRRFFFLGTFSFFFGERKFAMHCSIFGGVWLFFLFSRGVGLSITTENCIILFVTLFVSHFFVCLLVNLMPAHERCLLSFAASPAT